MAGPLDDITVLELANWVAGPSAGALMADMGARVVKVEPLAGDGMRNKLRQPVGAPPADHPFHLDNRGKRSVAVAIDDERGAALVRDLSKQSDVVITNLLPRRAARYGLGPDVLRADNPRLVYALVTGYGSTADEAERGGFDVTAFFGRAGIMSLLGEPDAPPPTSRAGQGDHPTGLALLVAILAALRDRDRTGEGQVVETALVRTGVWTIGLDVQAALLDGTQPGKRGRADAFGPMNTTYRCADGRWLNLCAQDQRRWPALCEQLGRPELAGDERFATPLDRFRNNREIIGILEEVFASAPADHWAGALAASGIIWEKVAELPDVVDDAQMRAIGMFVEVDHPTGAFETLAAPFTMSSSDVRVRGRAPEIGEHTEELLAELGIDDARVSELVDAGVLGCRSSPEA
jgi:crotonobetainyl-CoA:carnitine CoA-transferase CaiB-like acyl-CoA transferase